MDFYIFDILFISFQRTAFFDEADMENTIFLIPSIFISSNNNSNSISFSFGNLCIEFGYLKETEDE